VAQYSLFVLKVPLNPNQPTEVVVTTGAIRRAKLQSKCRHRPTNTQFFTGWMPFLSPNLQFQSTEGKKPKYNYSSMFKC